MYGFGPHNDTNKRAVLRESAGLLAPLLRIAVLAAARRRRHG